MALWNTPRSTSARVVGRRFDKQLKFSIAMCDILYGISLSCIGNFLFELVYVFSNIHSKTWYFFVFWFFANIVGRRSSVQNSHDEANRRSRFPSAYSLPASIAHGPSFIQSENRHGKRARQTEEIKRKELEIQGEGSMHAVGPIVRF